MENQTQQTTWVLEKISIERVRWGDNEGAHIEDVWYGCWKFIGRLDYLKTKEI